MLQPGENAALLPETLEYRFAVGADPECLDGDTLIELRIVARAFVDRAHAAARDLADDLERAEHAPDQRGYRGERRQIQPIERGDRRAIEHSASRIVRREQ